MAKLNSAGRRAHRSLQAIRVFPAALMAINTAVRDGAIMGASEIVSATRRRSELQEEAAMFLRRHEGPEMRPGNADTNVPPDQARVASARDPSPAAEDAFGIGAMDSERLAALAIPEVPWN